MLFITFGFLYTAPLKLYIFSMKAPTAIMGAGIPVFILTSIASMVYVVLCLCYRGYVEAIPEATSSISHYSAHICSICMQFKPERAHHCSRCKRCIKKMDHHCRWLGRCINYYTLGHFVRFLFFSLVSCSILFSFNVYYIYHSIFKLQAPVEIAPATVAVVSTLIAALIIVATGSHFFFQLRMVLNNITHIELLKKESIGFVHKDIYNSIYDEGVYNNLVDVFGSPLFLFLWLPSGDGVNFRKRIDQETLASSLYYDDSLFEEI